MQAVMLAAGKGTRMQPLETPKPLLKVAGKPIIEHNLSQLDLDEVIIVVGYKSQLIKDFLSKKKFNFKITFVEQENQSGTYDALLQAKELLKERFIVMNGDDIYSSQDINNCLKSELSILSKEVKDFKRFGILETTNNCLVKINEKPDHADKPLANTGLFVLNKKIFTSLEKSERGEYELTDAVNELAKTEKIHVYEAKGWIPIGYPWSLLEANKVIMSSLESDIQGTVEEGATVKNQVIIGKGTVIKSGSCIIGPVIIGKDCLIGPNSFINQFTVIGDNCKIDESVEIKNSILGNTISINKSSKFSDSVIGDNVNIGVGVFVINHRDDNKPVSVIVNGNPVNTDRIEFGCIIGDNLNLSDNTTIYPGKKVDKDTNPGEIIK